MFSTNEARPKYNSKVLKERYEVDKRYYRIHEVFNPSIKRQVVTGKFYSPHEGVDLSQADSDLVERLRLVKEEIPTHIYPEPVTGNQIYGWNPQLLVPLRKGDTRYYAPRNASISKINVTLKKKH